MHLFISNFTILPEDNQESVKSEYQLSLAMSLKVIRSVLGVDVIIEVEKEDGMLFAKCECPEKGCKNIEESTDNGFGTEHAVTITLGKLKGHLVAEHKWSESSESESTKG